MSKKTLVPEKGIYFEKSHIIYFDFSKPEKEWFKVEELDGHFNLTDIHIEGEQQLFGKNIEP